MQEYFEYARIRITMNIECFIVFFMLI